MSNAAPLMETGTDLLGLMQEARAAADALLGDATYKVRERVTVNGRTDSGLVEREQRATHGLAWLATYAEAIRQLLSYAERMSAQGRFGEIEELLVRIGAGEFLAQMAGGILMSQGELVRPADLGLDAKAVASRFTAGVEDLIANGNTAENRARLIALMANHSGATVGDCGLDDMLDTMREEMRKFADSEVMPHAQGWHRTNSYIPLEVIGHMAELGVFGLTIPEEYGGLGLGKESMCVVSEELSRGYIGVGSIGTRNEIAAELILGSGTDEQKTKWLPKLASGEVLPTAVFTEPNTGSDLASLRTRAQRDGDVYKVNGNKTWITHPVRADLMTLLVRTDPKEPGYRGLSMLLAEKPRGSDENPFPAPGMSGTEIEVLGYRGMKEYEIAFDGFEVKAEGLLGGVEGQGFKQLMQTFEVRAHPDRGARRGRRPGGDGPGDRLCQRPRAVRPEADRISPRRRQDRHDGGGDHDRAPDQLLRRPRKGQGPALRSRGRHGEAARRPRRLGRRRQCACRSTAATALRWNTRSRASCAMRASSRSSRARPKSRPR